jgi:hypothetical protein
MNKITTNNKPRRTYGVCLNTEIKYLITSRHQNIKPKAKIEIIIKKGVNL